MSQPIATAWRRLYVPSPRAGANRRFAMRLGSEFAAIVLSLDGCPRPNVTQRALDVVTGEVRIGHVVVPLRKAPLDGRAFLEELGEPHRRVFASGHSTLRDHAADGT